MFHRLFSLFSPHLVLGVHLGHHAVLQKVKGQDLQHVQLVGHLVVDGCGAPDHVLCMGGGGAVEFEGRGNEE